MNRKQIILPSIIFISCAGLAYGSNTSTDKQVGLTQNQAATAPQKAISQKKNPSTVSQKSVKNSKPNQSSSPGKKKIPSKKPTDKPANKSHNQKIASTQRPISVAKVTQKTVPSDNKNIINESELYELDSIKAVVFGEDTNRIIAQSDIKRPAIDGSVRSCQDMVLEQLIYDDGKKYKIVPDEEAIDKHLKTVQRENNLTQEDMIRIFQNAGYTFEEGKQQFATMTTVNSVVDFKIGSKRLIVPEAKIKEYYEEHPAYREPAYEIQRVFVAFKSDQSPEELKENIKNGLESLAWEPSFWIEHDQVAADKQFIYGMEVGDVCEPIEIAEGFELFYLRNKRERVLLTLDERRGEIADILRRPQFETALNEYKKELFDSGAVLYFE